MPSCSTRAVVYPTTLSPGTEILDSSPERQYPNHDEHGQRGPLECSVVDPGSSNATTYENVERDESGDVYLNFGSNVREVSRWRPATAPRLRTRSTSRVSSDSVRCWPIGLRLRDTDLPVHLLRGIHIQRLY